MSENSSYRRQAKKSQYIDDSRTWRISNQGSRTYRRHMKNTIQKKLEIIFKLFNVLSERERSITEIINSEWSVYSWKIIKLY